MNKRFFYLQLARNNLKRNQRNFIPYWLSCVVVVAFFFNLANLQRMIKAAEHVYGNTTVAGVLSFGTAIVAVLAAIFIFYANGFLMRNRKKEIGLYGILGLEKRHIARVLFYESAAVAVSAIAAGLLLGIVFGKLIFLLLARLIRYPVGVSYTIYGKPIFYSLVVFGLLFLAVLIFNLISMHLTEPIELLKSKNQGEKKMRFVKLTALIGLLCLSGGYYIAIAVTAPLTALLLFFVAVLLVIMATHYLFRAGSVVVLGALKKNRHFYYRPSNFISTSALIYRMRKNATGLANICILSCMVMVTVAGTAAVYHMTERRTQAEFPTAYVKSWEWEEGKDWLSIYRDLVEKYAAESHVAVSKFYDTERLGLMAQEKDGEFVTVQEWNSEEADSYRYISVLRQEDYTKITGETLPFTLRGKEIALSAGKSGQQLTEFTLEGVTYPVKAELNMEKLMDARMVGLSGQTVLLVAGETEMQAMQADLRKSQAARPAAGESGGDPYRIEQTMFFDLEGTPAAIAEFEQKAEASTILPDREKQLWLRGREAYQAELYGANGGLYFIGIFLGSLFLLLTVLIIYFKQMSEGEEDRERFSILKQVGLSRREAKQVIRRQLLMIFFLPLVTAIVHVSVATVIIGRILLVSFGILTSEVIPYMALTIAAFALLYLVVYLWTSRVYYVTVHRS